MQSASGTVYRERVTVFGDVEPRDDLGAGVERRLAQHELRGLGSQIADDPLRMVQALPGVTTGDDFRSEYLRARKPIPSCGDPHRRRDRALAAARGVGARRHGHR